MPSEVLDGVHRHPVVQHSFQEGVFAQFMGELHRYGLTTNDLARLTWVAMAASPGKDVTDDDELRARAARGPFAERRCAQRIGGVRLEALGLATALLGGTLGACRGQLGGG